MKKLPNYPSLKDFIAFTLAEVLITLGIIGVVAAMTIPTLMDRIRNQQLKGMWKKEYSTYSQSIMNILSDNNGTLVGLCNSGDHDCFLDKFLTYMKYIKKCNNGVAGCFYGDAEFKYLSGEPVTGWGVDASAVLSDGAIIDVYYGDSTCSWIGANSTTPSCGYLYVDVNGRKTPNTIGIDIFKMDVLANGIKPMGYSGGDSTADCITNPPSGKGYGCSALYILGE